MRLLSSFAGWTKVVVYHAPSLPRYWKRQLVNVLFWLLPDDELSAVFRGTVMKLAGCRIARGAMIRQGVRFGGFNLAMGEFSSIGACSHLDCYDEQITIGSNVVLSPKVTIVTASHSLDGYPGRAGATEPKPVVIDDGAWLGIGCLILPGVTIGSRSVVAAGSVVTRDVPSNKLVGGVPAKILRDLDANTETIQHIVPAPVPEV